MKYPFKKESFCIPVKNRPHCTKTFLGVATEYMRSTRRHETNINQRLVPYQDEQMHGQAFKRQKIYGGGNGMERIAQRGAY